MTFRYTIVFISVALILCTVQCKKNHGNEANVTAERGLSLRQEPTRNSKVITLLPLKAKVIIINENGPEEEIDGINGKWVRVNYYGSYGWVFNGYLEKGNDKISNLQVKQKINKPGEGEVVYTIPDSGGIALNSDKTSEIGFNTCEEQFELKGVYKIDNQIITINIIESPESIKHGVVKNTEIKIQIISDDEIKVISDVSVIDAGSRYKRGFCNPKKNDVYTRLDK